MLVASVNAAHPVNAADCVSIDTRASVVDAIEYVPELLPITTYSISRVPAGVEGGLASASDADDCDVPTAVESVPVPLHNAGGATYTPTHR